MGNGEECVGFTCFLVFPAYRLAPCGKASERGIKYFVAFILPLFAGFEDGEIVQLLVIGAEEDVDALISTKLGAELLA